MITLAPAQASETTNCGSLTGSKDRLACYDLNAPLNKMQEHDLELWKLTETTSDMDETRSVSIILKASKTIIADSRNQFDQSFLTIRCHEGTTSLIVSYSLVVGFGSAGTNVRFRVGQSPAMSETWENLRHNSAYGPAEGAATIALVKEMIDSDDFFIRGTSRLGGSSEALFALAGIDRAIGPVREACKW